VLAFFAMKPAVDHVQITVRDMAVSIPFYDRLLPLLGFSPEKRGTAVLAEHELHVLEYSHANLCFAISSPRKSVAGDGVHRRRPGSLHHLAFRAESREEVDRLHEAVRAIGAAIVSAPREYPEYTPAGYYAFFFKDPDGIKFEIVTHSLAAI
jgi:catechol 2,3-dioxygenase-like lactoylglutathione lyase family enzyme